ncbi:putative RING-H2 finger protein ATL21A [Salvia miltiorrhiza]|uniref:putative RING-H2 finger protein ATL21A n=1 Tax=Salvia miltiorrhiza TaxID=226208 RepID=UPI0025AB669B|nr:putative RING-H2 finger protein ATL21A [Salvia miltiorrhiza]
MAKATQFLIIIILLLLTLTAPVQPAGPCKTDSCHPSRGPRVRFPFRLRGRQPARCGYPGFNLRCNSRNQTILTLPRSGDFIVRHIDYKASAVYIGDTGFCLPGRALNFSVASSPFDATYLESFGILNCSDGLTDDVRMGNYYVVLPCLTTRNNTVVAVAEDFPDELVPPPCRRAGNVSVPPWTFSEFYWGSMGPEENFELRWSRPACGRCESRAGRCGFKEDSGFEVGCSKSSGLPRGAKYAVIIGGGVPGLLCMIGLTCYACRKIKLGRQQRGLDNELPMTTFGGQLIFRANTGLDVSTIESYPKTVLGQSRRLPNPNDNTCSICLSDYQPQETVKSIPECNHYFHANCIDEWLKLNGTCPLCRNSPESSSTTPTSSTSSSPSPSSTTSDPQ